MMAGRTKRTEPNRSASNGENLLKYACDAGFFSCAHPSDSPNSVGLDDEDSAVGVSSDSPSCESVCESTRLGDLAASFRLFSESMLRMEMAEMEIIKAREALRLEVERKRVESEAELSQMVLRTQLQIASLLKSPSRKRKRVEEDDSSTISEREKALLLCLLQCNMIF